jgi:ADP-ribosylglycohydrolase
MPTGITTGFAIMPYSNLTPIKQRAIAAFKLIYVADALAMPVHWFYNPQDILNAFPNGIQKLEAPPPKHPHDFLTLPATAEKQIVGDVILKDKRKFWGFPNQHVHQGMAAGDNTLNACCARLVMRTLAQNAGHYNEDAFLQNYIAFMTSEIPLHPDTYAEFYHRAFFENLEKGNAPDKCGQAADTTASMGGLVTVGPIAIAELLQERNLPKVQNICREHLWLTHPDASLAKICDHYVELIDSLLFRSEGENVKAIVAATAFKSIELDVKKLCEKNLDDNEVIGGKFSKACPITDSWPSLLYLAYKHSAEPKAALLANTNVGGENCHRGSVLGVVMGLATANGLDELFEVLVHKSDIIKEINLLGLVA